MATEVFLFRLADGARLDDFKSEASNIMVNQIGPQLGANGVDFVYFGQVIQESPSLGIIAYGWCDLKVYENAKTTA